MALNPVENLNVFDPDIRQRLRERSLSKNLVRTRAPFLRFTTGTDMSDASALGPQFDEYQGYRFFTLGLHGWDNIGSYNRSNIYGTQQDKGLMIGITYKEGEQKLVYTHGGGQTTSYENGAITVTAGQSAKNYPPPGIISAKVERLRSGNVLKFTIETQCYTQEQLTVLDAVCFVPGMTCILEWGTTFTTLDGVEKLQKTLNFTDTNYIYELIKATPFVSRTQFIETWCKPNKYNYDWAIANIANVKTRLENNVYKTTVVAYGKADNIMYISAYATANTLDEQTFNKQVQENAFTSVTEYFKPGGRFSNLLKSIVEQPTVFPRFKNKVLRFTDPAEVKSRTNMVPTSTDTGTSTNNIGFDDAYFISMDAFVNLILNDEDYGVLKIVNSAITEGNKLRYLIAPLGDNGTDVINVGYNVELRSTSPDVMILYNEKAIAKAGRSPIQTEVLQSIGYRPTQSPELAQAQSDIFTAFITNLKFGQNNSNAFSGQTPLFYGVYLNSRAIQSAFINARTFMEGMEVLLRNINAATENYWDLKIYYDDDIPAFRILDDNLRQVGFSRSDKIYEFNKKLNSLDSDVIGPDVLNIQVATDYPRLLFSQLAISGINNGVISGTPLRRDIDFKGSTRAKDIFSAGPIQPTTTTSTQADATTAVSSVTLSALSKNLSRGQRDIENQLNVEFTSAGFKLTDNLVRFLTDLYNINTLLTPQQSAEFRNRLNDIKRTQEFGQEQLRALTNIISLRAKNIIRRDKTTEIDNYTKSYTDYRNNLPDNVKATYPPPQGGTAGRTSVIDLVKNEIEKSRDDLLKRIDNASTIVLTPQQAEAQQRAQQRAEQNAPQAVGVPGRAGPGAIAARGGL